MVPTCCSERQDDWDEWPASLVYAYNTARHSSTKLVPFELMSGRKARLPSDLLRLEAVRDVDSLSGWYSDLESSLQVAGEAARSAIAKAHERQAPQYNQRSRGTRWFCVGDLVWVLPPPRGSGKPKLVHKWQGPAVIESEAGHDNYI